jgi:hypothetical protein
MCTVFFPGWKTAMPRLPRDDDGGHLRAIQHPGGPARSSTRRLSSIRRPSACSTSDSFGAQAVSPRNLVSA